MEFTTNLPMNITSPEEARKTMHDLSEQIQKILLRDYGDTHKAKIGELADVSEMLKGITHIDSKDTTMTQEVSISQSWKHGVVTQLIWPGENDESIRLNVRGESKLEERTQVFIIGVPSCLAVILSLFSHRAHIRILSTILWGAMGLGLGFALYWVLSKTLLNYLLGDNKMQNDFLASEIHEKLSSSLRTPLKIKGKGAAPSSPHSFEDLSEHNNQFSSH